MTGPLHGTQDSTPPAAPFSPPPLDQSPAFSAPDPPSRRPGPVVLAAIGLGVAALLKLLQSGISLVDAVWRTGDGDFTLVLRYVALDLLLGLALVVATVLMIAGRDGSRVIAAAVAGATVWNGAGWLINGTVVLVLQQASPLDWSWTYLASLLLVSLATLLALLALVLLAGRAAGEWFRHKGVARLGAAPGSV